jgi:alpha-tubulin suppressor-like RCC1 family protein
MPAANTTVTATYSVPLSGPYTVTYSTTGSTAGAAPTDPNLYAPGQAVMVQANLGYLFNPGHSFVGWNTAADGSGTAYAIGASLTMGSSNVTLYPQWNTQDWPVSVWGGARNAIVLKADSSVWTWGLNSNGQLGNGMTSDTSLPGQVLGPNGVGYLGGVVAVMGGEQHNLALKSDGTVWAWGMNLVNQLGNGNATDSWTPVQVSGLSSIVSIASRGYHSLAVKSDGTVWTWGEDRYGALGNGVADFNPDYTVPVQVQGLSHPLMVSSGYYFSVALMPDHTLMAWGNNANGELGIGTTNPSYTPTPVLGIDHVIWVSAGWTHVVAIKSDGTVWTWGANFWGGIYPGAGMLGDGTTLDHYLPEQVPGLAGAIQASGGDSFTSVLLRDGTVWTFGSNAAGQLGTGSFNPAQSLVPVQVQGLSNIVSIAGRDHHNQAIRNDGTVWSWGSGQNGELGNGTAQNSPTPVQVTGFGN